MPAKKPKPDEKPQSERFIETAREIGADETQEGFERAFKIVTSQSNGVCGTSPPGVKAVVTRREKDSVSRKKLG